MTCRDEILGAFDRLERRHGRLVFSPAEIVQEVLAITDRYPDYTIRTEVVSRMCADAPVHHATAYSDLDRVGRAQYRRRTPAPWPAELASPDEPALTPSAVTPDPPATVPDGPPALDLPAVLTALAAERAVFHSEADFQHALAWVIQREHPAARVRLEMRPERGIHLDVLVGLEGHRTAIELKYLVAGLNVVVDGERYDLPNRGAHDISRYDCCKDLWRVETFVRDGVATDGWVVVLTNDSAYWRPGTKADSIDQQFRIHEGRTLEGTLAWSARAGAGTIRGRTDPLPLAGRYSCHWQDYSTIERPTARPSLFRYLALPVNA